MWDIWPVILQEKNNAEYSIYINSVKKTLTTFCYPVYKTQPLKAELVFTQMFSGVNAHSN